MIPSAALASDVFVASGSAPSSDFVLVVFCFMLSAGLWFFLLPDGVVVVLLFPTSACFEVLLLITLLTSAPSVDEAVLVPLVSVGGGFEVLVLVSLVTLSSFASVDLELSSTGLEDVFSTCLVDVLLV